MVDPTTLPVVRIERRGVLDEVLDENKALRAALEELTTACEKDFCSDATEKDDMRCDDDEAVAAGMDGDKIDNCAVTFGMIRRARRLLSAGQQQNESGG